MINEIPENVKIALLSGFFGSLVRAILKPEKQWKAWLSQFIVGLLCAVFLGPHLALMFQMTETAGVGACCFLVGASGEQALVYLQNKFKSASK